MKFFTYIKAIGMEKYIKDIYITTITISEWDLAFQISAGHADHTNLTTSFGEYQLLSYVLSKFVGTILAEL